LIRNLIRLRKLIKYLIISIIVITVSFCILSCDITSNYSEEGMRSANKGDNGVWLGPGWIEKDSSSIYELLNHLSQYQVNRLYINLGFIEPIDSPNAYYQFHINFNDYSITSEDKEVPVNYFYSLLDFAETIKTYNIDYDTNFKIIGTINGEYKYNLLAEKSYRKDNLVDLIGNIIDYFNKSDLYIHNDKLFDGFQIDIEPISKIGTFLEIIEKTKSKLISNQFLSIAVCKSDLKYLNSIANSSIASEDEIALMAYDYRARSDYSYKKQVAEQTLAIIDILAQKGIDTSIFLPLYPEKSNHDPEIENIKNCLSAIMVAARDDYVYESFSRVIIYNYDELIYTSEWEQGFEDFKNYWLNESYIVEDTITGIIADDADSDISLQEQKSFSTVTSLIIDSSGSMEGNKIESAINSAYKMVDMIEQESNYSASENTISVINFNSNAYINIYPTDDYNQIRMFLDSLIYETGGETNIEDALYSCINSFESIINGGSVKKIAILLSDGLPNVGESTKDGLMYGPIEEFIDNNITLYTIGFGDQYDTESIDENLLESIADTTGGSYYYASGTYELSKIYVRLRHESKGNVFYSKTGTIYKDQTINLDPIEVTQGMGDLNITVGWEGSSIDLTLIDPKGTIVDTSYPNSSISTDTNPIYYIIDDPIAGNWNISLFGKDIDENGEEFEVISSTSKLRQPKEISNIIILILFIVLFVGAVLSIIIVIVVKNKRKMVFLYYQGRKIDIKDSIAIGRSPSNTIFINDKKASRNHARIDKSGKDYVLSDLGSRNGTFVNGTKVTSKILADGDNIKIGNTVMVFMIEK